MGWLFGRSSPVAPQEQGWYAYYSTDVPILQARFLRCLFTTPEMGRGQTRTNADRKPYACVLKEYVPQATKVAFVMLAEGFSPTAAMGKVNMYEP